jgi:hypothetical protein
MGSLQQQQGVRDFSMASHWCEKANLTMVNKERLAEVVPEGGCSEKSLDPA